MLRNVGEAFGDEVVGGDLVTLRKPFVEADGEPHGHRCSRHERLQPHREPVSGHDGGVDAAGELAQFLQGFRQLTLQLLELTRTRGVVCEAGFQHAELE